MEAEEKKKVRLPDEVLDKMEGGEENGSLEEPMTSEEFGKLGPISKHGRNTPAYCPRCVVASVASVARAASESKPKPHLFARPDCLRNHLVAYHHIMPLGHRVFVTLNGEFLAPASLRPATEEEIAKRADALEKKKNSNQARYLKKMQEGRSGGGDTEAEDPSPPSPLPAGTVSHAGGQSARQGPEGRGTAPTVTVQRQALELGRKVP